MTSQDEIEHELKSLQGQLLNTWKNMDRMESRWDWQESRWDQLFRCYMDLSSRVARCEQKSSYNRGATDIGRPFKIGIVTLLVTILLAMVGIVIAIAV